MNKEPQSRIRKNKMEVVKKLERKRKVLVKQLEEANRKNKQLRKEHVKLRVRSKLLQQDQQAEHGEIICATCLLAGEKEIVMIFCANCEEWHHVTCVGLPNVLEWVGQWHCPYCRGES